MSNNFNVSPAWARYRKLWIIVALLLFLLLLLLLLAGYSPWGTKCDVAPKVVEKEKLVDNPALLSRIGLLEKENASLKESQAEIDALKNENAQIASLKANVDELTKTRGMVAGLKANIASLETENASIADMKKRIMELEASNTQSNDDRNAALTKRVGELETENGLIAGLKAKVSALEAIDINFMKPQDNVPLLQKISGLEAKNLAIPVLESRLKVLEDEKPVLTKRIDELETENGLILGLQAKVKALEAVDINFVKPQDNTKLLQQINNLEVKTLAIPSLENRIKTLQAEKPVLTKRIGELETENSLISGLQAKVKALEAIDVNFIKAKDDSALLERISNLENENGMIPGLKAKIKALEAIDINFMSNDTSQGDSGSTMMVVPNTAKLFFQPGSSRFPTDAGQSMADVIVYMRANSSSTVSVAGFHDASGNSNWNRRLSNKRANRVKQILLDAGISESRITVETPIQTLGTGSPEEARRVEVKVSK